MLEKPDRKIDKLLLGLANKDLLPLDLSNGLYDSKGNRLQPHFNNNLAPVKMKMKTSNLTNIIPIVLKIHSIIFCIILQTLFQ